jgi:hypothetical protein
MQKVADQGRLKLASNSQFQKMKRRINERALLIAQESYTQMSSNVITASPVLSGLFRNNWFSGINAPNTSTTKATAKKAFGEKGGARFNDFLQITGKMKYGDTLFLTNSLPYARALEYGHSKRMAPHGMVRLSAAEWPYVVANVARKIR